MIPLGILAGATPRNFEDPHWANVVALLNMGGADGSTTFTDSTGLRTWTAAGNAQIDDSLGYNAALLDGSGDYISTPHGTDFDWYNNDYTMEIWINPVDLSTWAYADGPDYTVLLGHRTVSGWDAAWGFGPIRNGALQFRYFTGSTHQIVTSSGLITNNTSAHVAMSKSGSTIRIFAGGTLGASGTRQGSALQAITQPVVLGQGNNRSLSGRIQAVRLTKGIARYTSNFTPPAAPFPES